MRFYKHTPALLDPKTLADTLIGRDIEIDNLKRILKSASSGKSISHAMLVGPKGIGKTHILRIIYHAVIGDIKTKELNLYKDKFISVIFPEEEYLNNITKFILLILAYLGELNLEGIPPIPGELVKLATLDFKQRELALSYLKTFRKKSGKILLLLVDNLNDIIERFTGEDQASLREILMTYDSILLIGSAPTLFESIVNHDKPLYNFFEIIWLKDLPFEDTVALLKRYAEIETRNDIIEKLKESEPKLRAIHELAGGNPRLILSLYHIIVEGDITSVETAFLKLLDELNPYFRERMNDLSAQQREIIDVMARAEKLLTPTDISARCYVPVNVVNSQLKRLEEIGYASKSPKKYKKRVLYDLNERLFSLWRKMRVEAGRKRLGFIVKFLEMWFSKEELLTYLDRTLDEMRERMSFDHAEIHQEIDKLWYLKEALPEFKGKKEFCVACKRKDYDVALEIIEKKIKDSADGIKKLLCMATMYTGLKKFDKAIEKYKEAVRIRPKEYTIWANLGGAYGEFKKYDEAIEASKKAIEIKPDAPDIWSIWHDIGFSYFKLKRYDEAIEAYIKAIKIKHDNYGVWNHLGIAYGVQKSYDEAVKAFKKAIAIKPSNYIALINLGNTYSRFNRKQDAVEVYKKVIEIKPDVPEKWRIWYNLGFEYLNLKRYDDAIEASKKALERKPSDNCVWYILGHAYLALQRFNEALDAFKKAADVKHCGHRYKHMRWFNLWITHISLFFSDGLKGNTVSSIKNLKESLKCLSYITPEKDEVFDSYAMAFKNIVKAKKIDVVKMALEEIETSNQNDLSDFLSPYSRLVKYLETKDDEIIERLRYEERIIIEDMLRILEDKFEEKSEVIKRKKK